MTETRYQPRDDAPKVKTSVTLRPANFAFLKRLARMGGHNNLSWEINRLVEEKRYHTPVFDDRAESEVA